ncbi:hypothetical protein [Glycomyces tarimensis]
MSATTTAGGLRAERAAAPMRAGAVVKAYIADQVDALGRAIARTERYEPGSVALTCTAIHRIRAALRGYRHLFAEAPSGGPRLDRLLAALKRTDDLEALRVHFADRFAQLGLTAADHPRWYAALEAQQRDSYTQIERISSQAWVAMLLGQVRMFAEHARFTPDGDRPASSLMPVLTRAKTHLLDTYARLGRAADLTTALEATRAAALDARSLAEAAQPALGRAADDMIASATAMEELLTRHRLAVIAGNRLRRLPGADRADRLTTRLADLEQQQLRRLDDELDGAAAALAELWR